MKRNSILTIGVIVIAITNLYWPIRSVYKDHKKHVFLEQAEVEYQELVKFKVESRDQTLRKFQPYLDNAKAAGDRQDVANMNHLMTEVVVDYGKDIQTATKAIEKLRREMQ